MFKDVVIKVFLVINLVNDLVDAGRWLSCATLEALWTDNLTIVYNQLLIERRYQGQFIVHVLKYSTYRISASP